MSDRAALRRTAPAGISRAATTAAQRIGSALARRHGAGARGAAVKAHVAKQLKTTILDAVRIIAAGKRVTVRAEEELLTTQQAAHFLNVSRPYVVKLIESGKLPAVKVGRYRRLNRAALERYKEAWTKSRSAALDELAALSQTSRSRY
jgi:excisionase family DNA binding protein